MRIKKKILRIINKIDNDKILTKRFYNYVNKIEKTHRLIIKSKNGYHCDNCGYDFKSSMNYKANSYHKCPKCHLKLLVKTNKVQKIEQTDYFAILEKVDDYIIVRAFSIKTWYNKGIYTSRTCEYGRQTYDITYRFELISEAYNDNITATITGKFVNYRSLFSDNWRENGSYYNTLGTYYKLYPYNLSQILNGTKWEYSQLNKFAKKIDYFSIEDFFSTNSRTLEMLIKNKLYYLANDLILKCARDKFIKLDYKFIRQNLEYIRKYKLGINEIIILEYINNPNIKVIKKYSIYQAKLDELKKYNINLEIADKKVKLLSRNFDEYIDYLGYAKKLGYNMKDKKILYPEDMIRKHNEFYAKIEIIKNEKIDAAIKTRYEQLSKNTFKDKKYIVFPAKNLESMIDESSQMQNCVRDYAEKVANNECDIYFMRMINNENKSLVTIEVRNNEIVQKRIKGNDPTTKEQNKFLNKWEKEVLNAC